MLLVSGMKLSQSVEVIAYCFFVNLFVDTIIGFLKRILIFHLLYFLSRLISVKCGEKRSDAVPKESFEGNMK